MSRFLIEKLRNKFQNKKVLVVGLGLQGGGLGVAKFFAEIGARVTVTDKKNESDLLSSINKLKFLSINFHLGKHNLSDFLTADIIFKGPSVPWHLPELKAAQKKGVPIEMEISFFASNSPAKIIGITGTRGKSTTTHLIYEILRKNNFSVYLGGNVPNVSTIEYLKNLTANDWVVMELSSWSLSGFHQKKISPHMAVFTNFYPDHLNYYKTMEEYLYDKKAIYLYQKKEDFLIVNESLKSIIEKEKLKSQIIYFNSNSFLGESPNLIGVYNKENIAAALAVAKIFNLDLDCCFKIIKSFSGLPMRQQIVGKTRNIVFVNDSTSTTPIATTKALDNFNKKGKLILILGGNSKKLPYDNLINQLTKVEKIILLPGSFTDELLPILKKQYPKKISPVFNNLKKAVSEACRLAYKLNNKVYILFSPAATSFSLFNNEFHRGQEFDKIVKELCS